MKTIITLIILLAGTAWAGEDFIYPGTEKYLLTGTTTTQLDQLQINLIRRWAKEGRICDVLGHIWSEPYCTRVLTSNPPQYLYERKCSICGKMQSGSLRSGFDWQGAD